MRWLTRSAKSLLAALFVTVAALHVGAIFTENVNWDEFALLERAERTLQSGKLVGGGRPGLSTILLLPFVRGCRDAVRTVNAARVLWLLPTACIGAMLFLLLRRVLRQQANAWHSAAAGTALLILVPAFQRWSLQVRTDQWAVAGALTGGVLLVSGRRSPARAFAAGALFGAGFLSSQKLLYLLPLVAVLAALERARAGGVRAGAELLRAAAAACGFAATAGAFVLAAGWFAEGRPTLNAQGLAAAFGHYRSHVGYAAYLCMLPTLVPHGVLLALMLLASLDQAFFRGNDHRELLTAWSLLAIGTGVGAFHAGAFPYFWMTLGLYPAAALALAQGAILSLLRLRLLRLAYAAVLWSALTWNALPAAWALLEDTQKPQRDSLAFVQRNFPPEARGFHAEGGLFCRHEPDPLPVVMAEQAFRLRSDRDGANAFFERFRVLPVSYFVYTQHISLLPFGDSLKANYVRYRDHVWASGRMLSGDSARRHTVDLFAGGTYTWIPYQGADTVRVDGRPLAAGAGLDLTGGPHAVELEPGQVGLLVLKLPEPPSGETPPPFYSLAMRYEIEGGCVRWKPFGPLM